MTNEVAPEKTALAVTTIAPIGLAGTNKWWAWLLLVAGICIAAYFIYRLYSRRTQQQKKEYIDRGPVATNGKLLLFRISRSHAWKIVKDCAWKAGLGRLVNPETGEVRGISPPTVCAMPLLSTL